MGSSRHSCPHCRCEYHHPRGTVFRRFGRWLFGCGAKRQCMACKERFVLPGGLTWTRVSTLCAICVLVALLGLVVVGRARSPITIVKEWVVATYKVAYGADNRQKIKEHWGFLYGSDYSMKDDYHSHEE